MHAVPNPLAREEMGREVKAHLGQLAGEIETWLAGCLDDLDIPDPLREAMAYSLAAGGKRLRPALCLTTASLFGLPRQAVMPFAGAIECIHTYSLIHDDLPAMDDDDLRRGKPSNHKVFGEARAILAGDGLLTEAFRMMTMAPLPADRLLRALAAVATAAGAAGMVGGQTLDMAYERRGDVTLAMLTDMHARKTGALIRAACASGAILAGAEATDLAGVEAYGADLGLAFQIADDILDEVGDAASLGKPVGSDRDQGKTTFVTLLGLERSRELARETACRAAERARELPGTGGESRFLELLARYVVERGC